jgi:hypothetical protein
VGKGGEVGEGGGGRGVGEVASAAGYPAPGASTTPSSKVRTACSNFLPARLAKDCLSSLRLSL